MLETKDLCKTYKPKKGVPVVAIDHVTLRFPEKGMVFLLGKSGSGKSTMLNLLGGLDQYDDGEIIIKGISSKDFNQQRFDSYRNTYVGFIFQEYNVLEEFTVGANIGLALELQGKTAADDEINAILEKVDLAGYGTRKPNELSGGQKQRVAIARALVKNPEIIMADEPTGALDSNTGRQVLDTLKRLSEDKLVIVVSHDREYAETYADRIIEMADGKVIRDVEAIHNDGTEGDKQLVFRSTSIEIPSDYHLTEEDRIQINEYLDKIRSGASMMLPSRTQKFRETDTSTIPVQDGSKFQLIHSKLPMRSAFKIGCSSLKHKRFRLVMTILLSVVAFTLFSLVDTFGSYNHIRACTDSLIDSHENFVSLNKVHRLGSGTTSWWSSNGLRVSEQEMKKVSDDLGLPMTGIFIPKSANLNFAAQYDPSYEFTKNQYYRIHPDNFCGYAEIDEQMIEDMGYELVAGKLPDGSKDEIAISSLVCETFMKAGYRAPQDDDFEYTEGTTMAGIPAKEVTTMAGTPAKASGSSKYEKINAPIDMIGKVIRLMDTDYTVTGVVNTNFDTERYQELTEDPVGDSNMDSLRKMMLDNELRDEVYYSLTGCMMVGKGKVAEMLKTDPKMYDSVGGNISVNYDSMSGYWGGVYSQYYSSLENVPESDIFWLDGKKDHLEDNEIIASVENISLQTSSNNVMLYDPSFDEMTEEDKTALAEELKENLESYEQEGGGNWKMNYYDNYSDDQEEPKDCKIVGVIFPDSAYTGTMVVSAANLEKLKISPDGVYDSIVGPMPKERTAVETLSRYCNDYDDDTTDRYEMNNAVIYELETINEGLQTIAIVFLWIGLFFAIFAALLMANFITTSIHYKRQEIGILRAIGSRSNDVFRIFFSESFVIAMINFLISAVLCCAAVLILNFVIRQYGILVTILHFGIRQILLLLAVSVGTAALASFLPVRKIASKRPIDAIRDR